MGKRILFYLAYNRWMTGAPRVLLTLLDNMDRSRFTPLVVTQREGPLTCALGQRSIPTEVLPLPAILDVYEGRALEYSAPALAQAVVALVRYNDQVRRLAQRSEVDLFWCRNIKTVLFTGLAARSLRVPLIWDVGLEPPSRGLVRLLHWLGLGLSNVVVNQAVHQHSQMFGVIVSRMMRRRLRTIDPAITSERLESLKRLCGTRTEETRPLVLLNVGPLMPRKNQLLLLRAVAAIVKRFPELRVLLVGPTSDGSYADRLHRFVRNNQLGETVEFLGWRDDIAELLANADLLVLTSKNEGLPQIVREAMHARLPIVATRVGGVPAAVRDGVTGRLVPEDDAQALARALEDLLRDHDMRQQMGLEASRIAEARFTIERWIASYEHLLEALTSASADRHVRPLSASE